MLCDTVGGCHAPQAGGPLGCGPTVWCARVRCSRAHTTHTADPPHVVCGPRLIPPRSSIKHFERSTRSEADESHRSECFLPSSKRGMNSVWRTQQSRAAVVPHADAIEWNAGSESHHGIPRPRAPASGEDRWQNPAARLSLEDPPPPLALPSKLPALNNARSAFFCLHSGQNPPPPDEMTLWARSNFP